MSEKNKVIVILGPTASGKSDVAVSLALRLRSGQAKKLGIKGSEIISADSRQVYKKLDIGTGKITKKEMKGVPHHLLDVANPKQRFSVAQYKMLTNRTIRQIVNNCKIPILCGGTGFYIDSVINDTSLPPVPPNKKIREKLNKKSTSQLFKILKKLDPARAESIDVKNPRRLVRAIEIAKVLGKVPKIKPQKSKHKVLKIGIKTEEKELKKRIDKRIDKWFEEGLLKEVKDLHKKGLSWKRMSELGLEYKIVANFLRGPLRKKVSRVPLDISGLKKEMSEKTWQYAKRQITWFKRDENIIWLPPKINLIEKEVKKFLI